MAGVSREDLLEYMGLVDANLRGRCKEEDLKELSLHVAGPWENLAQHLNLSKADIEDIDAERSGHEMKVLHALQKWKTKYAFKASFGSLVDTFLKLGDAEMAEKVCMQLKKSLTSESAAVVNHSPTINTVKNEAAAIPSEDGALNEGQKRPSKHRSLHREDYGQILETLGSSLGGDGEVVSILGRMLKK